MIKRLLLTICLLALPLQVWGAAISTLTDNFNDNSIDAAKWGTYLSGGCTVVETNNELELNGSVAGGTANLYSKNSYDLTSSQSTIKIIDLGTQYEDYSFLFGIYTPDEASNVHWYITNGNIAAYNQGTNLANTTYVSATYRFLKIRESGGNIYFDYSSTGLDGSWYNFASVGNPFVVTSIITELATFSYISQATTAKVDDFNILPSATRRIIFIQ